MEITKKQLQQIQTIMSSRFADRDERLDFISAYFEKEIKSTKELTSVEADNFIYFLNTGIRRESSWAFFDKDTFVSERKLLFSYMHQAQWTMPHETLNEVPDLERLSNFLKCNRSPVNKPLKQFEKQDWNKLIQCFRNIVKGTYK